MLKTEILRRLYKIIQKNILVKLFSQLHFQYWCRKYICNCLASGFSNKKLFIEKDQTLIIIIPLMIIVAFTVKGSSLYFAKVTMISVGERN